MERLTKRIGEYVYYTQGKYPDTTASEMAKDDVRNALQKLAEYEDLGLTPEQIKQIDALYREKCEELAEYKKLKEQGLILKLPCKVGDTVYTITYGNVAKKEVRAFEIWENYIWVMGEYNTTLGRIGHNVFLTKEAAEMKLAELGCGTNG